MPSLTFLVFVAVAVLANDFFAHERKADKKIKSQLLKNIPPAYWSYKTVDDILRGDE